MNNQSTLNLTSTEQPYPILPHASNNLWRHVQKQVSTPRLMFFLSQFRHGISATDKGS